MSRLCGRDHCGSSVSPGAQQHTRNTQSHSMGVRRMHLSSWKVGRGQNMDWILLQQNGPLFFLYFEINFLSKILIFFFFSFTFCHEFKSDADPLASAWLFPFCLVSRHGVANLKVTHLPVTFSSLLPTPPCLCLYSVDTTSFSFFPPPSGLNSPTKYFLSLSVTPLASLTMALEPGNCFFCFFSLGLACNVKSEAQDQTTRRTVTLIR